MRRFKVLLDFAKYSVAMLVEFAAYVALKLTGNPDVPDPDVAPAVITAAVNKLVAAKLAADDGGKEETVLMHQAKDELIELLRKDAASVEKAADGNPAIILGAGYNPSHQPDPAERPIFRVEFGNNPGEIILVRKAIETAGAYVWQYMLATATVWTFAGASTQAHFKVTGLTTGTKYQFRCCGVIPAGMTPWCDPITKVAP